MVVPERQVNHGKNVAWRPRYAFAPGASIDELSNTLRFIDQKLPKSLSIKAGGSRHSWSPAAATSGVYIHPEGIRFIEPAADASMKASVPSALRDKLVRVGSGTRVRELNAALWERGLSLPALGGFDGQTLGGVLPTGTHGSVLKHGPLASRVRSIDLVTARGEHVRIEPKDGLTDPVRFAREHPKMSLVQDDATFQAAQINMGTMGVVHAYVLEAAERFHLTEVRTKTDVADVLRVLEDGNVYHAMDVDQVPPGTPPDRGLRFEGQPERAHHLEVLLNPHSDQVIITSRQPTEVDVEPFDMSRRPGRDLFRSLDLGDRFTRPALSTWLSENLPQAMGWTAEKLTRLLPAATPKVVDQARRQRDPRAVRDLVRAARGRSLPEGAPDLPRHGPGVRREGGPLPDRPAVDALRPRERGHARRGGGRVQLREHLRGRHAARRGDDEGVPRRAHRRARR